MKNLTLIAFAALMAFFVLQGCEKDHLADIGGEKIKATKTEIEQYELDTLLFTGAAATDSVKWTVAPANSGVIQNKGNKAIIYFFKTGTYTVSAQKLNRWYNAKHYNYSGTAQTTSFCTRSRYY
jgi:hypothetical protein